MADFEGLPEGAEVVQYEGLPEGAEIVKEIPKPITSSPRPSYWQGMKNVTGNYLSTFAQPIKMGAEAGLGWVEALGTGVKQTGAMLGQGAAAVGGGPQGVLQAASEAQHEQLQRPILPEWVHGVSGSPSWMAQGMGGTVNELVERGVISRDTAQNVGNLLMLVGMGGVKPAFAKLTAPYKPSPVVNAIRRVPGAVATASDRFRQAFPSPEVRAGAVLDDAGKVISQNVPQRTAELAAIKSRMAQQAEAQQILGVGRFPEGVAPNPRRRNLAAKLERDFADVAQSETLLGTAVADKAKQAIGELIPREDINPARHNFLVAQLESYNAAKTAEAESAAAAARDAAYAAKRSIAEQAKDAAVAAAKQASDEVSNLVPKTQMRGAQETQIGERVIERLRGREGDKPADTGIVAVRKVFNEAYKPFDEDVNGLAPSEKMGEALKAAASDASDEGRAMANYMGMAKQAEQRLSTPADVPEIGKSGGETGNVVSVPQFPTVAPIPWWRGLKGELYTAMNMAKTAGHNDAARRLGDLARMAEAGEDAAVQKLGPEKATAYGELKQAYKTAYHQSLREGYVGKIQIPGSTWHGGVVNPTTVLPAMMDLKNVNSILQAFGAEAAVKSGKVPTGVSEAELRALGLPVAREIVRPYVESVLASMYALAGGGVKGAKKVAAYLSNPKNAKVLNEYGLDFDKLRSAALTVDEPMARLTGARIEAAKGFVADVLPTTDPALVAKKILDAPSAVSMYKNFLGVSKDSAWKSSIDTLVTNELQARVEAGKDIFSDPKSLGLMQAMWSPEQVKGLRVYYDTLKTLAEKTPKSEAPELPEHALDVVSQLGQAFPVGMKMWYAGKYMAKALAKMHILADDAVAVQWLADAVVNPKKEKLVMDAYRGHKVAGEKLKAAVEADRKVIAELQKRYKPTEKTASNIIGRAAVTGAQNPYSGMDNAALMSAE